MGLSQRLRLHAPNIMFRQPPMTRNRTPATPSRRRNQRLKLAAAGTQPPGRPVSGRRRQFRKLRRPRLGVAREAEACQWILSSTSRCSHQVQTQTQAWGTQPARIQTPRSPSLRHHSSQSATLTRTVPIAVTAAITALTGALSGVSRVRVTVIVTRTRTVSCNQRHHDPDGQRLRHMAACQRVQQVPVVEDTLTVVEACECSGRTTRLPP